MPILGFGVFQIPADGSTYRVVKDALEVGYRHPLDIAHLTGCAIITLKLIYASLGTLLNTSRAGRRFFKLCIETFANQNVTLILSIGQGQNLAQYGSLSDNIHIYERVPQLEVLQKADLFITHGGMNSVNEAIYFGVPMIVLPIGNDQPTVAKQVQACGLGQELAIRSIDSSHLQEAVEDVLSNPHYADQARYYSDLSVQAGGNQAIVAKIEAFMSERQA